MCLRFLNAWTLLFLSVFSLAAADGSSKQRVLRVCSDPNNLPFSNEKREGFENRIADLIARELGARLEYTWFAQRRGFVRNTLRAGLCDLVMGVPAHYDPVETTAPYYRSSYVFVTRADSKYRVTSIEDPLLRRLHIGVHIVGDDYANPPPVHALGRRGITRNVSGYTVYGDYSQPNPPARLLEALAEGKIDIAVVWGPFGGYFGQRHFPPLRVVAIAQENDGPNLPFTFEIAMGVRKGDTRLRDEMQGIIDKRKREIDAILVQYGVPLKPMRRR
jgi:mxaJ protein